MALITSVFNDPFFDLERTIDQMFDRGMGRWSSVAEPKQQQQQQQQVTPAGLNASVLGSLGRAGHAFDIIERPQAYELIADAPGLSPCDIHVELHDKVLTISGQHKEESREEKEGRVWRSERRSYQFKRSFALPDNAKADDIAASLDKGVLTVSIPKLPEPEKPQPRQIKVQSAAA